MKLVHRITIGFIAALLVMLLFVMLFTNHIFVRTFQDYLVRQQDKRLSQIIEEINDLFLSNDEPFTEKALDGYVKNEAINIRILDPDNRLIAAYEGLGDLPKNRQVLRRYAVLSPKTGERVALIEITLDAGNLEFMRSVDLFRMRTLRSSLLLFLFAATVALPLTYFLSRRLTTPIEKISAAARKIREKDYLPDLPESNVTEIRELSRDIRYLAASLKAQEELRLEYAQDISHELRTPLTNLRLHLEAIEDGIISPDREAMDVLRRNTRILQDIVDRLKDTFQDASLLSEYTPEFLNASLFVQELLAGFEGAFQSKKIRLVPVIEENRNLYTDRRLLGHVLNNLIANALKAVSEGGMIRISLHNRDKEVTIQVEDDGIGIRKEDLPHIFERFYRADPSRSTDQESKGLGLSIAKNMVSRMGGTIKVSSRYGEGTKFTLTFPQ